MLNRSSNGSDHQDRVRQRHHDVADRHRVQTDVRCRSRSSRSAPCRTRLNNTSNEIPNTRYGITSGANTSAENAGLPRKTRRTSAYEASTPSTTVIRARQAIATNALRSSDVSSAGFDAAREYHCVVNPCKREGDVAAVEREDHEHQQRRRRGTQPAHEEHAQAPTARRGDVASSHHRRTVPQLEEPPAEDTMMRRHHEQQEQRVHRPALPVQRLRELVLDRVAEQEAARRPPTSCGVTNSPIVGTNTKTNAAITPGRLRPAA